MRVFLDDRRTTPPGWVRCYTPAEVLYCLSQGTVTDLSLDHDLGLTDEAGQEVTGYHVLLWLEEQVCTGDWPHSIPEITVHSDNGPGREKMLAAVESINRKRVDNT